MFISESLTEQQINIQAFTNYYNDCSMDISQFETSTNNALLQIQRAQRVLDETQLKMKRFRKQKQSASKLTSNFEYRATPLPDIKQYLSYLIQDNHEDEQPSHTINIFKPTTQGRNNHSRSTNNMESDLQNIKKTKKAQRTQRADQLGNVFDGKGLQHQNMNFLNIQKHTQQQLEKSQAVRLQKIQEMYKQQFQHLDNKIDELYKNRDKIKKDKLLLMRNNQELEQKISEMRKKNMQGNQNNKYFPVIDQLRSQISKLQKKLAKIQMENNRIVKRKQQLEANMRICIRNSKQQLEGQLVIRKNKSKSAINYKCPYH